MESDSPKELDVNKKIAEALKVSLGKFFESHDDEETEPCDGVMSTEGDDEFEPFDGVFYIDGDDEPIVVDPETTTMGDLERLMDEAEDKRLLVDELLDWMSTRTKGDVDLAARLMKKGARRLDNKSKQKDPCRIIVKGDGIFVELPDQKLKKVTFGRGNLSKTLYIFYLRQIVRAEKDNAISTSLSQVELEDYKEELLNIYQNISGKQGNIMDVESWLEKGTISNTFANATASIRKYFDKLFDNYVINYKWEKCYSIEIIGEDKYGNPRYGIKLTPDDFVLKWPFEVC